MFTDMCIYVYVHMCIYMDDIEKMKGLHVVGIHTTRGKGGWIQDGDTGRSSHTQVLRFN